MVALLASRHHYLGVGTRGMLNNLGCHCAAAGLVVWRAVRQTAVSLHVKEGLLLVSLFPSPQALGAALHSTELDSLFMTFYGHGLCSSLDLQSKFNGHSSVPDGVR